jgi:hypothetical protein
VWEHVTKSDRTPPTREVLAQVADPRARQFWDPGRSLSGWLLDELPADTLDSVSEPDSTGRLAWNCLLLYRAGVRWNDVVPTPDWSAQPIAEHLEEFTARLRRIAARRTR